MTLSFDHADIHIVDMQSYNHNIHNMDYIKVNDIALRCKFHSVVLQHLTFHKALDTAAAAAYIPCIGLPGPGPAASRTGLGVEA